MTRLSKAASWFGRFLELRLRAFIYALFALNGFIIGTILMFGMAEVAIADMGEQTRAAILEANSK